MTNDIINTGTIANLLSDLRGAIDLTQKLDPTGEHPLAFGIVSQTEYGFVEGPEGYVLQPSDSKMVDVEMLKLINDYPQEEETYFISKRDRIKGPEDYIIPILKDNYNKEISKKPIKFIEEPEKASPWDTIFPTSTPTPAGPTLTPFMFQMGPKRREIVLTTGLLEEIAESGFVPELNEFRLVLSHDNQAYILKRKEDGGKSQ